MAAVVQVEDLDDPGADDEAREMLVELTFGEQLHYQHPRETRGELATRLRPAARFTGENHLLVARTAERGAAGLCWVVLFDPGTGLEAEIAELYVRPEHRSHGVAAALIGAAMELIRRRHVTFACVWTRHDNAAALAAYSAAGFRPTEQAVLTWLPLQSEADDQPG